MSDPDVHSSVFGIIAAFTSGLDIFKKLRERRRKRKGRRSRDEAEKVSGDELQLSNSLRKAPMDIQTEYERKYDYAGERFARGDAIAHRSLTETLIKLNTGLVGIISSFLSCGKHDSHLDYKSLTHLSNTSRLEVICALSELSLRLSQSNIDLYQPMPPASRSGSSRPSNNGRRSESRKTDKRKKKVPEKIPVNEDGLAVTKYPLKGASKPQIVMVRPRTRRTTSGGSQNASSASSTSSTKSSSSNSTALTTPNMSPLSSPDVLRIGAFPREPSPERQEKSKSKPPAPSKRKPRDSSQQRPDTWPASKSEKKTAPPVSQKPQDLRRPPKKSSSLPPQSSTPPPAYQEDQPSPLPSTANFERRRRDVATPSMAYSFMSNSTKLGEIPVRHWTVSFDQEEADRMNAEAAASGWRPAEFDPVRKRGRFLGIFPRRGSD